MMFRKVGALAIVALATTLGLAAPPTLEIPAEVRPAGEYVRFTPKTDALGVTYVGLSGLDPFPSEELKDSKRFLLHTRGVAPGKYKFAAIGSNDKGEQTRTDFTVVLDGPPVPPAPVPPGPVPGPTPGPVDPTSFLTPPLYVIIVEETRNRTPAQGKVIVDYAARSTAAGTKFKVMDVSDPVVTALALDKVANATGLPAVVVRDSKGIDRGFKLPATAPEIETTVKGLVKP